MEQVGEHLALKCGSYCSKCEIKLEGEEPWEFPGAADDLEIIHTPGHTYGHIVLLHKPSRCGPSWPAFCYIAACLALGNSTEAGMLVA